MVVTSSVPKEFEFVSPVSAYSSISRQRPENRALEARSSSLPTTPYRMASPDAIPPRRPHYSPVLPVPPDAGLKLESNLH